MGGPGGVVMAWSRFGRSEVGIPSFEPSAKTLVGSYVVGFVDIGDSEILVQTRTGSTLDSRVNFTRKKRTSIPTWKFPPACAILVPSISAFNA